MWVPPFRHPRIVGYLPLPAAFRSLSRLSSALSAKASALCPFLLDLFGHPCPPGRIALHPGFCMVPHAWYVPIPFFWLFDVFLRISGCFPPTSFPCVNFSRYNHQRLDGAGQLPSSSPMRPGCLPAIRYPKHLGALITGKPRQGGGPLLAGRPSLTLYIKGPCLVFFW